MKTATVRELTLHERRRPVGAKIDEMKGSSIHDSSPPIHSVLGDLQFSFINHGN